MKKSEREKIKKKIPQFVKECGIGTEGLSEKHKIARMKRLLGNQHKKLRKLNKGKGVKILSELSRKVPTENMKHSIKPLEKLPDELLDNLEEYPDDESWETALAKIIDIRIRDDGSKEMDGIIINGNERNPLRRTIYGIRSPSDERLAKLEYKQFKAGILKDLSERTMRIHKEKGRLDEILEKVDRVV